MSGRFLASLAAIGLLGGCSDLPVAAPPSPEADTRTHSPIRLELAGSSAGLSFALGNKGKSPLTILETSGGGCAFLDFDSDGWPDILLAGPNNAALYRNQQDGTFRDVTEQSGIARNRYWMGCATGDYDGDNLTDIFLTGYRTHALYRNTGDGRFDDVTYRAGITGLFWSLSAAFADLNGDDRLDLFVSQYLRFDENTQQICTVGRTQSACGPEVYDAISGKLFLNRGNRFESVPWKDTGKTWGVLASRIGSGQTPWLYLANDMMPGDLWRKNAASFENIGPASGTAYDAQGHLQGGMGVDSGDYDNDGKLDLIVTTYFAQMSSLYRNDGNGLFTVVSSATGLGPPTMPYVAFGVAFVDLDNDGWQDLVIANGHVRDNVHDFDSSQTYAQPVQVFRNERGRFVDVTVSALREPVRAVGRGLSIGDYDRDGRVDVLICDLEGQAILLRNRSEGGNWLRVRLAQPGGNRHAEGAFIRIRNDQGAQVREIRSNGSVLAGREPAAWFGVGSHSGEVEAEIEWPDGKLQKARLPVNRETAVAKR